MSSRIRSGSVSFERFLSLYCAPGNQMTFSSGSILESVASVFSGIPSRVARSRSLSIGMRSGSGGRTTTGQVGPSIAISRSTQMSAAPRIRTAWIPADTSHQGAFSMSFMAFSLSSQILQGFGELDHRQFSALAEVEDVDDVRPGHVGGGVDDDGEGGLAGALVVALHGEDRVDELLVRGDGVADNLPVRRLPVRIPAHEDANLFEDELGIVGGRVRTLVLGEPRVDASFQLFEVEGAHEE